MAQITIAEALRELDSFLQILDNAYWEAATLAHKDRFYDIINSVHIENNELAKLSIQDHYLSYEPVTAGFRNSQPKLQQLLDELPMWVQRSSTSESLAQELPQIIRLLKTDK